MNKQGIVYTHLNDTTHRHKEDSQTRHSQVQGMADSRLWAGKVPAVVMTAVRGVD